MTWPIANDGSRHFQYGTMGIWGGGGGKKEIMAVTGYRANVETKSMSEKTQVRQNVRGGRARGHIICVFRQQ